MYDDNEGSSSIYLALKGAFAIIVIVFFVYLVSIFIRKLKERKLQSSLTDILKLSWMIGSLIIIIYLLTLFFPEFSVKDWNRRFTEHLPFQKGLLGAITSIIAAFLVGIFCIGGIATYFEKPKEKNKGDLK